MSWSGDAAREVRQFVEVAQCLRFGLRREQEGDLVDLGFGVAGQCNPQRLDMSPRDG